MSLEDWQKRLHAHFGALAKERSVTGYPVFALEHGLDPSERDALLGEVRSSLALRKPSDAFWLPWVVYATEIGYEYDGEEYWQTFKERTPGWVTCRSRPEYWLRDRFVRFQHTYRGLQPSGRWASWFTIIAWPIQHAILPGYLQYHLAKLLYDLRFDLTPELLADHLALGQYLHDESAHCVQRLQEFAEEYALIGTIATALLLSGNASTNASILSGTLQRLIKDLEREQRAKDWLRIAQDQARHVSLRGLGTRGPTGPKSTIPGTTITKKDVPEFEPRLLVIPVADNAWRVCLETPDFAALTTRYPRFRGVLASSRCVVGTGNGRWQSRGWLLHGPHRVPLDAWPKPDDVLLRLERSDPTLDALLRTDFLLRPGPTWLFKIGADGIGYEIRSRAVRAGQRYVIVTNDGAVKFQAPAQPATVSCTGISAATITVPQPLDAQTEVYLERLGLDVWQTISVWPAGCCAAAWDGAGWAEWLVNDTPCIGISSDKPIEYVEVLLEDGSRLRVAPEQPAAPVFVVLPGLRIGQHHLTVRVQNAWPNPTEQVGHLDFVIRAPRPRLEGYRALFRVTTEPERASLDDLWRGTVHVSVLGPSGNKVTPRLELAAGPGLAPLAHKVLPRMSMPATPNDWRAMFRDHCDADSALGNALDDAKEGRLCFDAGELGTTTLRFEHERRPLRWHVRRTSSGCTLRLVNETSHETTSVTLYAFEHPDHALPRDHEQFTKPCPVPAPSGLFLAQNQQVLAGVITPPIDNHKGLAGMRLTPQLRQRQRTPADIASVLDLCSWWTAARAMHDTLLFSFRRRVIETLEAGVFDLLYQESQALGKQTGTNREKRANSLLYSIPETTIRHALPGLAPELLAAPVHQRPDIFAARLCPLVPHAWQHAADAHNDRRWIAEFALRLASAPHTLRTWAGERLTDGLRFALKHASIMRAARHVVLVGDGAHGARPLAAGPLHEGWDWP